MNFFKTILLLNDFSTKTLLILLLTSSCFTFVQAQFVGAAHDGGCATEQVNKAVYEVNPDLKTQLQAKLQALKNQPQHKSGSAMDNVVPVVFHIIPTPCGTDFTDDFTRDKLLGMLDEVNIDFAGQNTDEYNSSIDPTFYPIRAGNIGLTFRLAEVDPNGNPTDGFTRPTTSFYSYNGGVDKILKDIVRWDNRKYLNVWVVQDVANASGFAHYPYTAIVQPEIDGIVMDKDYLINGTSEKTNRPNILTHEIGHWLGLLHAWGDPYYDVTGDGRSCEPNNQQGDCGCDDLVDDTPKCEQFVAINCPSNLPIACEGGAHNVHNMMDYGCEVMFTQGQANRMWSMINNNIGGRGEVVTNNNDQSVFMDSRSDKNYAKLYLNKGVFRESDSNPGTISETGIIELRGCNNCSFSNNIDFTVSGLPTSISQNDITITRLNNDNQKAEISFNLNLSNPADHTNDIENISITLNQNAIVGTSQVFNNRTIGGLKIDFRKEELAFNGQSAATFAANDFTAIFIPYLRTEVGFSRQSVNDGSIRMYSAVPLEAAVTGSNSFNIKRLGDNQNISSESFRQVTGGAPNDPDNLILYHPQTHTDWLNQTGYVGIRTNTCGITYYAWIRIEVTSAGVNILDMVVNLENNAPLNTGQYPACDPPRSYDTNFIYIESVNIGQINNVSGNNNGYQFFQNYTTDLIEGQTYTLDCEGNKPQAGYEGEWRVYVDLNGDGSYLDPDDLRYSINEREEINADVELIPTGTLNGQTQLTTKMMIIFSLHPLRGICEDYQYGETEEYNVTIKSSGTSSCNAPVPTSGNLSVGAYSNYAYGYCNGHSSNNKEFELTNLSTGSTSTYASTSHYAYFGNLTPGTNYQFRVRLECGNTGTYGNWSPYHNFTTISSSSCNAPTPTSGNLSVGAYSNYAYGYCNGHSGNNKEFELTNLSTGSISTYASTSHYATFSNLTPGTNYRFRVRLECGNTGTYGNWSPYKNFTTISSSSCNAPTPTSGNLSNGAYCNYAYGYCNGHSGNNKEFELTNLSTGTTSTHASNSHYAYFGGLTPSTNYQFRVRLECGNTGTYGNWSPYNNFTTTSCKTETELLNLNNYPNPFNDHTTIEFSLPDDSSVTLTVYDLTGRQIATLLDNEVKPAGSHRIIFDGSKHPSGMYMYTLQTGEYTGTGKMNIVK